MIDPLKEGKEIKVKYIPDQWEPRDELLCSAIDGKRNSLQQDSTQYNGGLCRVKKYSEDDGIIHLLLEGTDFASELITREIPDWDRSANALSVVALLESQDGMITGKRNPGCTGVYSGSYGLPGGALERSANIHEMTSGDITDQLRQEIREETGLQPDEIDAMNPLSVLSPEGDVALLYYCSTPLDEASIERRFRQQAVDEFLHLDYVSSGYVPGDLTPAAAEAFANYTGATEV